MNRSTRILTFLSIVFLVGCASESGSGPSPSSNLSFPSASLPSASTGVAYAESLSATGGTEPYSWRVDVAHLPPGITHHGSSDHIVFSGIPTTAGNYAFAVAVLDADFDSVGSTISLAVSDSIDFNGVWNFALEVTHAEGPCVDEVGDTSTESIVLTAVPASTPVISP
jgi:hypothetical protein